MPRSASCRAASDERNDTSNKDMIRTDVVLENVYGRLLTERFRSVAATPMNAKETNVCRSLKKNIDAFKEDHVGPVKTLCAELETATGDSFGSVLRGIADELYSDGVTWSRIIAYFVFVGELAKLSIARGAPGTDVDVLYECFSGLVEEKLARWIEDHGGWEGVESDSDTPREKEDTVETSSERSWAKGLLYGSVRVIGILAHVSNSDTFNRLF